MRRLLGWHAELSECACVSSSTTSALRVCVCVRVRATWMDLLPNKSGAIKRDGEKHKDGQLFQCASSGVLSGSFFCGD